jgi:hypothetical protein
MSKFVCRKWVSLGVLSLIGFCTLCFAVSAYAQLPTGTILGVVKDSSGGVVGGADVTITNIDTNLSRNATTQEDGAYRFPALPVGNYTVRVSKQGFQTAERKGLQLEVAAEAAIDVTLQVGSTGQTVTVTEEAPLVNTTSSAVGGLVSEEKMADLPLNGRNYTDLTLMQAGVNSVKSSGTSGGQGVGEWYSSNGAPPRSNQYMLDGAILSNLAGATASSMAGTTLGLDGIREYKVVTNSFSAEYGLSMGSQVTMVSRSGANAFHGTAFEYIRNSAMDARNAFDLPDVNNTNGFGTDKSFAYPGKRLPQFQRNNFGASFGGPIRKDKTFFFATFEQLNERLGLSVYNNGALPASCHVNNGTAAAPLVDTSCFVQGASHTGVNAAVNPIAYSLVPIFPLPSFPQLINGKLVNTDPYIQPTGDRFGQIRLDQNFSNADSFFARYTVDDAYKKQGSTAFFPNEFHNEWISRSQYLTLSETHIFSPALVNSARISYSRTNQIAETPTTIPAGVPLLVTGFRFGSASITGLQGFGPDCCDPAKNTQNLYTISDDVFLTRGKHAFKFGTLIDKVQDRASLAAFTPGTLSASSIQNFLTANFQTAQDELPGANEYRNVKYTTIGLYGQDDYRVSSRLTLNLGLRYEFNTTPREANGLDSALRSITDNSGTVGPMQKNHSYLNFSPRIGFAWDIFGNGKTSLRGGGGVFYDVGNIGALIIQQLIGTPPFSGRTTVSSSSNGFTNAPPFVLPLDTWFAQFGTGGNKATPVQVGKFLQTIDYNGGQPHLWVSNLTIERQLPLNSSLSVGYASSRGDQIYRIIEGNPVVPNPGNLVNGIPTYVGGEPRTNPNWNSIRDTRPSSYTWYDSLQVSFQKRPTHGLQFQLNYTWSKLLDTTQGVLPNDGTGGSGSLGADPYNQFYDKGPAVFNIPQNVKFNATYRLPQLIKSDSMMSKLANGWFMSTITSWQKGYPFTPSLGTNRSLGQIDGGAGGVDRPNWAAGCDSSNAILGQPGEWFKPECFAVPALGTLGNVARDTLTGPGLSEIDLSLNKDTKAKFLGEQGVIQFRAEVFNIANHANYAPPSGGVASPPTVANAGATSGSCPTAGCAIAPIGTAVLPINTIAATGTAGSITSTGTNTSRQIQLALRIIF